MKSRRQEQMDMYLNYNKECHFKHSRYNADGRGRIVGVKLGLFKHRYIVKYQMIASGSPNGIKVTLPHVRFVKPSHIDIIN